MIRSGMVVMALALAPGLAQGGEAAPAPAVAKAEEAIRTLQQRLVAKLGAAMKAGGPPAAVTVCRDEAPRIAAEVSKDLGVRIGRTSDRLRNPGNAAPAWAAEAVRAAAGKAAKDVTGATVALPDGVGVLRPIAIGSTCLGCHGGEKVSPEVAAALGKAYPRDQARGYAEGDHRGFFWVEVPGR